MLKWIKNSKGSVTNNSTNYKGISITQSGKYKAFVRVRNKGFVKKSKQHILYIGVYDNIKEAKKARINYILELL